MMSTPVPEGYLKFKCAGEVKDGAPEGSTVLFTHIHLPRLNSFKHLPQRSAIREITRTFSTGPLHECFRRRLPNVSHICEQTVTNADIPSNRWSTEL